MTNIYCSSVAEFFNPILTKNIQGSDIRVDVNLLSPNAKQNIVNECMDLLTRSFQNSLIEEVGNFIEQEYYRNYTTIVSDSTTNIKYHTTNPSLFELSASKIAYYLFPENFAEYRFIIRPNMDVNDEIDAGYNSSTNEATACNAVHLDGVENVYATAFYLGLEIRSHQCISSENKSHLFVDDFSHPFHEADIQRNELIDEYRDHKVSSERGTLFPTTPLDPKCGEWLGRDCDIEKLKDAYEKIVSIPKDKINEIINTAVRVLQSIECPDNQDDSCNANNYYQYMDHDVKGILSNNYDSIQQSLVANVEG